MNKTLDKGLMSNYYSYMKNTKNVVSLISKIRDKANSIIITELKKNKISDLAPSHGAILNLLYNSKSDINMMDISKKICKDKSTVTALINKLSKLNYIKKLKSVNDKRITYIVLTKKGWNLKPIFENVSSVLLNTVYKDFSQSEKENLIAKLEKILNNI